MAYTYPGPVYTRYYYGFYGPHWAATTRNDSEIAADIRNRLTWDSWVDADQVQVGVNNRVVTLNGTVDSIVEKRAAGDDTWDTPGVVDVNNDLKVRRPVPQR
jgi:osmotically-inducible protein OsmY